MPEISVIVPVYNAEKFISRCYDSIKAQTFKDFEIIFVNDGSVDNSADILNQIASFDKKVKVINQKNQKQGAARNRGIKEAGGKYISFVDVDDFISEDFLESLYFVCRKYGCEVASVGVVRVKENGTRQELMRHGEINVYKEPKEKAREAYQDGTGKGVWNKLFLKEFLVKNNLKFRENVFYEDSDFCAKAVFLANALGTSDKGNYFYFVNKNSTMRKNFNRQKQKERYEGAKLTALYELKNGIIESDITIPKYDFSFFGLNLIRIKEKINIDVTLEEWFLFDFVKIFEKKFKTIL